jgi:hypothetical protein
MLSFELKKAAKGESPDEVEVFLDHKGLESLLAQLRFLETDQTEHIHLMTEAWGGSHLDDKPQGKGNTSINHVKVMIR